MSMMYCLAVIKREFPRTYCRVIPRQSTVFTNATHMITVNMNSVTETRETTPPDVRSRLRLAERASSAYDVEGLYTELRAVERIHTHAHALVSDARALEEDFLLRNTSKGPFEHDIVAKMSMTVKAYLLGKDDCNKEIRRFAVDQDVSTSFDYLNRKVLDVFVGLGTAPFQMHYKGTSD